MPDWYPETQAALITWHNNFATQAAINGTTLGLSAAEVTQIAADADNVLIMLNGMEAANVYRAVAVDMRRDGGAFSQNGSTISAAFVDETEPLVEGAAEVREYRIQGIDSANNRVGDVSEITRISTTP